MSDVRVGQLAWLFRGETPTLVWVTGDIDPCAWVIKAYGHRLSTPEVEHKGWLYVFPDDLNRLVKDMEERELNLRREREELEGMTPEELEHYYDVNHLRG